MMDVSTQQDDVKDTGGETSAVANDSDSASASAGRAAHSRKLLDDECDTDGIARKTSLWDMFDARAVRHRGRVSEQEIAERRATFGEHHTQSCVVG